MTEVFPDCLFLSSFKRHLDDSLPDAPLILESLVGSQQ
jgi:hypothetical protein